MKRKTYKQLRVVITLFVSSIVAIGVINDNYILSVTGVLTGIILLVLARLSAKIVTDERESSIQEKSARVTYAIFVPTLGISSLLLTFPSKSGLSIFSKGEWLYVESIGMILAYLTLFQIVLYAVIYYYFSRIYGGNSNEE